MGAIIFALGLWIRFDEDFQKWVKGLGMQHYWTGIYILMFIGLVIMVVSFFGCCGVVTEARWMLKVSDGLTLEDRKRVDNDVCRKRRHRQTSMCDIMPWFVAELMFAYTDGVLWLN